MGKMRPLNEMVRMQTKSAIADLYESTEYALHIIHCLLIIFLMHHEETYINPH